MAILKGFPPSNTISCGISFGNSSANSFKTVEKPAKLKHLKPLEKFKADWQGNGVLQKFVFFGIPAIGTVQAVCYEADPKESNNYAIPGDDFLFDEEQEVIWLQKVWGDGEGMEADCCREYGTKLTSDDLSDKFGDYCGNPECTLYK